MIMYLYEASADARAHLPSLSSSDTDVMDLSNDVKGATILASESLNAIPTWAVLSAPQSLLPSPHIIVTLPSSIKEVTTATLWFGVHRPNTRVNWVNEAASFGLDCRNISQASPVIAISAFALMSEIETILSSDSSTHTMPEPSLLPINTFLSGLIIPLSFAIRIPVRRLSPVTITVRTLPSSSSRRTAGVSSRKTFLKLTTPTKVSSFSTSSLEILLNSVSAGRTLLAMLIWYTPCFALL
mmetsp:Transcript_1710/g.3022  ORF Transcript_1710/g.3022 Transcript_1710/m.3022 type:complete len:241 (-) Transcript_1710:2581-3303(-)